MIKIKILGHQRNGVCGEPFIMALVMDSEYPASNMLATFALTQNGPCESKWDVNVETCRVVDLNNFEAGWRGDCYGYEIQKIVIKELSARNEKFTCNLGTCNCKGKSAVIYDLKGQILPIEL